MEQENYRVILLHEQLFFQEFFFDEMSLFCKDAISFIMLFAWLFVSVIPEPIIAESLLLTILKLFY